MNIRDKTPAELENQVARFSIDSVEAQPTPLYGKSDYQSAGEIAVKLLELRPDRLLSDVAFRSENLEVTDDDIAETLLDYTRFLKDRNKDPEARQRYKAGALMIERYTTEFKAIIDASPEDKGTIEILDETKDDPPFVITKDGQEYAVRKVKTYTGFAVVEKHLEAALRVQGIPRLEQIEAISYVDNVTVAPRLAGEQMETVLENGDLTNVTMDQIEAIYESMRQANNRGVGFDGYGENLLYDKEKGFSMVDMGLFDGDVYRSAADTLYVHTAQLMETRSNSAEILYSADRFADLVAAVIGKDTIAPAVKRRFIESQEDLQDRIQARLLRQSFSG